MSESIQDDHTPNPKSFGDSLAGDRDVEELLIFEMDDELYAVPVAMIEQVLKIPPITPVPNAPRSVVGIFHLRGKVIVAIDLLRRMRLARKKPFAPNYLLIARVRKDDFAILIDRAITILRISSGEIAAPDPVVCAHIPLPYVRGLIMCRNEERKKTLRYKDIMITRDKNNEHNMEEPSSSLRPVIVLNMPLIFDQNDLLAGGSSQGGGQT